MNQSAVALPEPVETDGRRAAPLTRAEVRELNAATHERLNTQGAVRIQLAYFRCPWPCSPHIYRSVRKTAIDRWVRYMELTGWVLVSKVGCRPDKRRQAYDLRGDFYSLPTLGEVEVPVAAAFKKLDLRIVRVEVPVTDD